MVNLPQKIINQLTYKNGGEELSKSSLPFEIRQMLIHTLFGLGATAHFEITVDNKSEFESFVKILKEYEIDIVLNKKNGVCSFKYGNFEHGLYGGLSATIKVD